MHSKVILLSARRQTLDWRSSVRRLHVLSVAGALFVGCSFLAAGTLRAANTEDDVLSGLAANSNLSSAASYSTAAPSTGGVPTTTSDVTFTSGGTYTSPYTFGSSLSIGSLNDLSATALTLQGNADTLTLNGGDSISGNTADLLYVASGANLTLANTGTLGIALGASGNFDVVGTAAISAPITGAFALTKTGAGTLTLTSTGNTFSGGTTVSAGTLALGAGGGSGVLRGAVTINTGATLSLNGNNALGYSSGTQVTVLNINGGTVTTDAAHNRRGLSDELQPYRRHPGVHRHQQRQRLPDRRRGCHRAEHYFQRQREPLHHQWHRQHPLRQPAHQRGQRDNHEWRRPPDFRADQLGWYLRGHQERGGQPVSERLQRLYRRDDRQRRHAYAGHR